MVGSIGHVLTEAITNGNEFKFMKLRFCTATKKPMVYLTMRAAGVFEVQCGFERCSCVPLQLVDLICDESECVTLSDETIQFLTTAGFSRILLVPAEKRNELATFEEALRKVSFFAARSSTPKKAIRKAKEAESEDEAPVKRKSVKEITKKKVAKKVVKKPTKKASGRDFIDDEAEEGSETEHSDMEEDDE